MPSYFTQFKDFFPTAEQDEVQEFLDLVISDGEIMGVEQLAISPRSQVANILSNDTTSSYKHFGKLFNSFSPISKTLWAAVQPADPAKPTPYELQKLGSVWDTFYSSFSGHRQKAIQFLAQQYIQKNFEYNFGDFQRAKTSEFLGYLNSYYFELFADYYIQMAKLFVQANQHSYRITAQIVDENNTEQGISEVRVTIVDENNADFIRNFGYTYSNYNGHFSFLLTTLEEVTTRYELKLICERPDLGIDDIQTPEFDVSDASLVHIIEVSINAASTDSAEISTVIEHANFGTAPSGPLLTFLSANNFLTLRNIREAGGLKHHENIPDKGEAAVLTLDALANLEIVCSDYVNSLDLYNAGISNLSQIANSPRSGFVSDHRGVLGDYNAAQVHYTARTAHGAIISIAESHTLNGGPESPTQSPVKCGCQECVSAVSPLSYYADLLYFTFNNIKSSTNYLDFPFLHNNFHMPFGNLLASCKQLEQTICQNRLAVEVLRSYYAAIEGSISQGKKDAFEKDEVYYLELAYRDLLTQLGTSFEELRNVHNHPDDSKRQKLANRLGIVLEYNSDPDETLAQLFVDLSATPSVLTEELLESLFGLRDSKRNPITFPDASKVSLWKKAYLRSVWLEQDYPTNPYFKKEKAVIDPDIVTIDDIRYPTPGHSGKVFEVWENRREWIDQKIADNPSGPGIDPPFALTFFSKLFESHSYTSVSNVTTAIAIIWPLPVYPATLIGNLRTIQQAIKSGDQNAVSTLMSTYKLTVSQLNRILEIQDKYASGIQDPLIKQELRSIRTSVVKRSFHDAWKLEEVAEDITLGAHLFWHAQIAPKEGQWPLQITDTPWVDPQLISRNQLTEYPAFKSFFETDDLYEERKVQLEIQRQAIRTRYNNNTDNDNHGFAEMLFYAFTGGNFDPEVVKPLYWDPAGEAWGFEQYNEVEEEWVPKTTPPTGYTEEYWYPEYPDPVTPGAGDYRVRYSYQGLFNQSTSAAHVEDAISIIESVLKMTLKDFQFMMSIGNALTTEYNIPGATYVHDPLGGFAEPDWVRLVDILLKSHKINVLYTEWIQVEEGIDYWKIRKAQLPAWRASVAERKEWERALTENSSAPIIDAALTGPAYLKNIDPESQAAELLIERHYEMFGVSGWKTELNEFDLSDEEDAYDNFQEMLNEYIGLPEGSLIALDDLQNAGVSISNRLKQLTLTATEFQFLLKIELILSADPVGSLTEGEIDQVHLIIINVLKTRKALQYKYQEWNNGINSITHSQDFFKVPVDNNMVFPAIEASPLKPWIASAANQYQWKRKLTGRIAQENSVLEALIESTYSTDENLIHVLRDALIKCVGNSSLTLGENARILGDRFLIDLENNCCFKTNRVAMAIEVLQQLIWKTRTGQILEAYPNITSGISDFDSTWTWMGSYGNWRAAMFVFLYPENLMIPSLRKTQTPAFRNVISATEGNRRFTPHQACEVAREYQQYLKDVANLKLVCSARAIVITGKEGCNPSLDKKEDLVFHFAECPGSAKSYYSISRPVSSTIKEQLTFWTEIPNIHPKAELKGTHVYINSNQEAHHIYLFYLHEDNPATFYALRFDLHKNRWEEQALEFEIEESNLWCDVWIDPSEDTLIYSNPPPYNLTPQQLAFWSVQPQYSSWHSTYLNRVKEWYASDQFSTTISSFCVQQNVPSHTSPQIAISLYNSNDRVKGFMTFKNGLNPTGLKLGEGSWYSLKAYNLIVAEGEIDAYKIYGNSPPIMQVVRKYKHYQESNIIHIENTSIPDLEGKVAFVNLAYDYAWEWENYRTLLTLISDYAPNTCRFRVLYNLPGHGRQIGQPEFSSPINPVSVFSQPVEPHHDGLSNLAFILGDNNNFCKINLSDVNALNVSPISSQGFNNTPFVPYSVHNTPYVPGTNPINQLEITNFRQLSYQNNSIFQSFWSYDISTNILTFSNHKLQLTPILGQVSTITNEHTASTLVSLKQASQSAFLSNVLPNPKLLEYIREANYFVPLQIALQLTQCGHYLQALDWFRTIYDYSLPENERKVYYGLVYEEDINSTFQRAADWFIDPLNPHAVAKIRQHSYTRYTIMCIVQCMLAYADNEFTSDTAETVPRARELYETALSLLRLITPENTCPVEEMTLVLNDIDVDPHWMHNWNEAVSELFKLEDLETLQDTINGIKDIMDSEDDISVQIHQVRELVEGASSGGTPHNFEEIIEHISEHVSGNVELALGRTGFNAQVEQIAAEGAVLFGHTMTQVTGFRHDELHSETIEWLADPKEMMEQYNDKDTWPLSKDFPAIVDNFTIVNPNDAFNLNSPMPDIWTSGVPGTFCSATNPIITALNMHAHVNLYKIRNCMNIVGMVRELSPFAAPTDATSGVPSIGIGGTLSLPLSNSIPPSPYRYRVLMERAKQLVALAQQMESAFLTAIEKLDAETYSQLRAKHDLESSRANIKLQELKVKESESNVELAELQKERSQLQVSELQGMISSDLLPAEQAILSNINEAMTLSIMASIFGNLGSGLSATAGASLAGTGAAIAAALAYAAKGALDVQTIRIQSQMQMNQIYAAFERRVQEWSYQITMAQKDIEIGGQQIKIANDRLRISGQEREMAQLQNTHAQASMDFLRNKFTNAELYAFMTKILEDVYDFFLMEATAVAKMAERQLAFERQLDLPAMIKSDYWVYEDNSLASGVGTSESPDRRGITGSARLLKDLYNLDQQGFMANSPRLQMVKNFSLNQLDPVAMQQFRDTGILSFHTTQNMFDRDHPGHYLRLIKGVSVSVIALTPPIEGIKATLTNGGISRVVTGGMVFQEREIKRYPEQIALSNPSQDKGLLPLQQESEFLNPFEGSGVETAWELRMERAANPFDYSTIADVIFTIEYEATHSTIYRQTILNRLNSEEYPGALVISFKNNLPDQWYELHNPVIGEDNQMQVSFNLSQADLLPHTINPMMNEVKMFVASQLDSEVELTLKLMGADVNDSDSTVETLEESSTVDKLAKFESQLPGLSPVGKWTLQLDNYNSIVHMFQEEKVEDILLIINYSGLPVLYTK